MAATQPQKSEIPSAKSKQDQNEIPISELLDKRKSDELVLAFAGPVGCGTKLVISETEAALKSIGYEVHVIKLSGFIQTSLDKKEITIDTTAYDSHSESMKRIVRLQDGGNELRKNSTSILAQYAVREIVVKRGEQKEEVRFEGALKDYVPKRTAYLIDQIKHPDEVALFRVIYRHLFHLIGVISVAEKRKGRLTGDKVKAHEISDVMERDRRQEEDNGQQLDKALQMADFFLSTDHGTTPSLQRKLKRFFGLLHGENGITPTFQEYGMYARPSHQNSLTIIWTPLNWQGICVLTDRQDAVLYPAFLQRTCPCWPRWNSQTHS